MWKVVWTGFHYLPWLAQKNEGVGAMSSLLILDVYAPDSKMPRDVVMLV